ncbi:protein fuzzy homolog [Tubulanus polymorphus]|uniref:protein fuzzy homolog n=1 Tax=Tubulanus polymorphus TaxID=672921 RepID=UPI003DA5848B
MAVRHLYCFTADGGVPIFSKTKGDAKQLPFPVIGGLNGLDIYAENHAAKLLSASSDNSNVIWKVFHDSFRILLVKQEDETDVKFAVQQIVYVFNALVLMYGFENLVPIKNVEKLKKEVKVASSLIDTLLEGRGSPLLCGVTHSVDVIACPENLILQSYLEAFIEAADSPYGCLFIRGKIIAASKKWWSLSQLEQVLLSLLNVSLPECSFRDIPIYLPKASPKVPHRLLTFQLVNGVEVWVICGPKPSLVELEREVSRFWRTAFEALKSLTWVHPRNLPTTVQLDASVLALLLVDTASRRCVSSVCPSTESLRQRQTARDTSPDYRRDLLRMFYKKVVGDIFESVPNIDDEDTDLDKGIQRFSELLHKAKETYTVTNTHKLYALQDKNHQLFLLFSTNIPTFAMRSVTKKTLEACLKDKSVQFALSSR